MSGYKHSGLSQEDYYARLAYGAYYRMDDEQRRNAWEAMHETNRQRWRETAEAVAQETREEPRWFTWLRR